MRFGNLYNNKDGKTSSPTGNDLRNKGPGRKEPNNTIPILLFINGGLIILGLVIVMAMANFEMDQNTIRTIGSTMLTGGILIGLGIAKIVMDKKKLRTK